MPARRRQGDAGHLGKFAHREGAPVHQRREHVGAGGVAEKRGDGGDDGAILHRSILTEASSAGHRL